MHELSLGELLKLIPSLGPFTLLVIGVVLMARGVIVWGREKEAAERERDEWRARYDRAEQMLQRSLNLAESGNRVIQTVTEKQP